MVSKLSIDVSHFAFCIFCPLLGRNKRGNWPAVTCDRALAGDCRAGKCSNLSEILSRPRLFAHVTVTTDCRSREPAFERQLELWCLWPAWNCLSWLWWGSTCCGQSPAGPRLSSPKLSVQPHNWSTQSAPSSKSDPNFGDRIWGSSHPVEQVATSRGVSESARASTLSPSPAGSPSQPPSVSLNRVFCKYILLSKILRLTWSKIGK